MTIFEDEIVNSKAFEHASLIFTEPWVLANVEYIGNLIFSKTNFRPTGVYVLSSRTLYDFSNEFFSVYRGILELKNDTTILRKNDSFANKMCCSLTVLIVKNENLLLSF